MTTQKFTDMYGKLQTTLFPAILAFARCEYVSQLFDQNRMKNEVTNGKTSHKSTKPRSKTSILRGFTQSKVVFLDEETQQTMNQTINSTRKFLTWQGNFSLNFTQKTNISLSSEI